MPLFGGMRNRRFGHVPVLLAPQASFQNNTPLRQHVIQFQENVFHHLYGTGANDVKESMKEKKECLVALHHFHPGLRQFLLEKKSAFEMYQVPFSVGKACGLSEHDVCKTGPTNRENKTCIISPSIQMK